MSDSPADTPYVPSTAGESHSSGGHHGQGSGNITKLALGAVGVVFGDIGTSPSMPSAKPSSARIRWRSTNCTYSASSA
ncbi:hypothetical protein ACFSLT_18590 [Novosphingobium resinovorum]